MHASNLNPIQAIIPGHSWNVLFKVSRFSCLNYDLRKIIYTKGIYKIYAPVDLFHGMLFIYKEVISKA